MLYQEGLAEVIHSNPSEQVAYLLAERASLLERNEGPDGAMSHGDTPFTSQLEAEAQRKDNSGHVRGTSWPKPLSLLFFFIFIL